MQAKNCKERILNLKEWRVERGLTVDQCIELCGNYPSESTIRKFFQKGSENKSFRESTVATIELALLGKVYEPGIKIPVEDVTRTIEEAVKPLADENRRLHQETQKQRHIINSLLMLVGCCIVFFSGVAIYDFATNGTGFWNSHSYPVWIAKVAFLCCVAAVMLYYFFAQRRLEARFAAEEKAAEEAAVV